MGRIITEEIFVPVNRQMRTARIWLPASYDWSGRTYPVLYMQDGQNVFSDETASFGRSLRMSALLDKREREGQELVVIALDNGGETRCGEYSPWEGVERRDDYIEGLPYGGQGEEYAAFFAEEFVPLMQKRFRICRDSGHAALAGASLGAWISAYMGLRNPELFGTLGLFSFSLWFSPEEFFYYMDEMPFCPAQRYFIYAGTEETGDGDESRRLKQLYLGGSLLLARKLLERGTQIRDLDLRVAVGEHHCEEAWEKYVPDFLDFFFQKEEARSAEKEFLELARPQGF